MPQSLTAVEPFLFFFREKKMAPAQVIVFVGLLVFQAHLFSSLFTLMKFPDVLLLMLISLAPCPIFHIITTADFGKIGDVFTSITLDLIVFTF